MAKAFESLFGSVTCLPGCFTLYRLRTPDTHKPLLISNQIVTDYSENRVDTLHMKNLLHLGEDRYLTTLLLKHFPHFKTQFVRDAHAFTVAPDDWKVLLSQRRRWINSMVHNLGELIFLEQLCGFCCFSLQFIVMIDLVSTIIQPVTVAYVSYFITLRRLNYSFSSPCRSYICCISLSERAKISLCCHWSWLRLFMVFKHWSSSWDGEWNWRIVDARWYDKIRSPSSPSSLGSEASPPAKHRSPSNRSDSQVYLSPPESSMTSTAWQNYMHIQNFNVNINMNDGYYPHSGSPTTPVPQTDMSMVYQLPNHNQGMQMEIAPDSHYSHPPPLSCRLWRRKQRRRSAACYLVSLPISAYILATDGQFCDESFCFVLNKSRPLFPLETAFLKTTRASKGQAKVSIILAIFQVPD